MERESFAETDSREFDRQDIIDAIVRARGVEAGETANQAGIDFDIADGLNALGYKVIPPQPTIDSA